MAISKTTIITVSAVVALISAGVISTSVSSADAQASASNAHVVSVKLKAEWQKGYSDGLVVGAKNGAASQKASDQSVSDAALDAAESKGKTEGAASQKASDQSAITTAEQAGEAKGKSEQARADTPKDETQVQANEAAKNYMQLGTGFSRSGMISQLEFQGFSASVSATAATSVGLN